MAVLQLAEAFSGANAIKPDQIRSLQATLMRDRTTPATHIHTVLEEGKYRGQTVCVLASVGEVKALLSELSSEAHVDGIEVFADDGVRGEHQLRLMVKGYP